MDIQDGDIITLNGDIVPVFIHKLNAVKETFLVAVDEDEEHFSEHKFSDVSSVYRMIT
jgi:hypothetical protein